MKRNKESKARVRIFSWLGLNKSEQMEVDRYLKKHNSNYRVLYKKFKMFNEILMTAADLGFGDEYYFEKQGIVIAGSYNRKSMDKTKWYTVNIDKLNEILRSAQNEQMDCSKWTDGEFKTNSSSAQNEQSNTREYAENTSYNSSENKNIGIQGDFPDEPENHLSISSVPLENIRTKSQPIKSRQKRKNSKQFDIDILERQVRKACKKIEPDRTEETVQVFRMFYEEWYRTFGWRGAHPRNLSQKEVENCVFDMWTLYGEHGFICDLDVEMYSELIPLYLGTTFDEDCDYSFTHFTSGDIRAIKMYEWERNA